MFCPECGCEYRSGFTTCAGCRVDLVSELPAVEPTSASGTDAEFVVLCSFPPPPHPEAGAQPDARVLSSRLRRAGVPFLVSGGGGLAHWCEPVTLHVRLCDVSRARRLLDGPPSPAEVVPAEPSPGRGDEASPTG